ncbi:MAG: TetR family transcriptional regulator [Actinomycetota bacterium]|nr:TetR family transcriptional regulator [Actinomycetota bacterium]
MTRAGARGRRPGGPDTRGDILRAARTSFAGKGFDRTTIRGVAGEAGVDPALVHHYFGSKDDLFLAALEIPIDPRLLIPQVFGPGLDGVGERLVRTFLGVWDQPSNRLGLVALVRTAFVADEAAELLRDGMARMVLGAVVPLLEGERTEVRAQLVTSQLMGLIVGRYVMRIQPLASLPAEELVAWVAPTLQRYLTGELPG